MITESPNSELNVPKPMPRAKSTGNITGVVNPVPTPRLRDSPTDDNNVPVPRPRPAPRRDVQSAFVPTLNSNFQENLQQMSFELNQIEPVKSGVSHAEGHLSSQFNSILDAPNSPVSVPKSDPFDTSSIDTKFINPNVNIPTMTYVENSSSQSNTNNQINHSFPEPTFSPPSGPPPPVSPPPSPPTGDHSLEEINVSPRLIDQNCPSHPPPNLPPPPPPRPVDGPPSNLPPVPSRPIVPSRPPASIPNNLPPVPSRNLPPVPPRN